MLDETEVQIQPFRQVMEIPDYTILNDLKKSDSVEKKEKNSDMGSDCAYFSGPDDDNQSDNVEFGHL